VVSAALLTTAVAVFAVGVVVVFAGSQAPGRTVGLAAMGAGAVAAVLSVDPAAATTWALAVPAAVTLAGLVWFATVLGRWAAEPGGAVPTLDDEPTR
jgi:hypothetical protein